MNQPKEGNSLQDGDDLGAPEAEPSETEAAEVAAEREEIDPIEDDYNQGNYRGLTAEEFYQEYRDDMDRAETMDITALTASVVGLGVGVLSAYFFLEGGDPDRYQRFRGMGSESALPTVTLSPATGGGLFSWHFQF